MDGYYVKEISAKLLIIVNRFSILISSFRSVDEIELLLAGQERLSADNFLSHIEVCGTGQPVACVLALAPEIFIERHL